MKFFCVTLIICVLQACSSQPLSSNDNTDNNAKQTAPEKYPVNAFIRLNHKNFPLCEAFLIGPTSVLTAAGCVQKYKTSPLSLELVAGSSTTEKVELEKNAQIRKVSEVKIHPYWISSKNRIADIAILKVSRPFKITENVKTSPFGREMPTNGTALLVGYGDNEKLTSQRLRVPSTQECNDAGITDESLGKTTFCAKYKNDDGEDEEIASVSRSYAGAPVLFADSDKYEVYGLVPSKGYGIFTNIAYYADWIESTTGISRTKNTQEESTTPAPTTSSPESTTTTATTTK